jgi:endonuclease/exonuclease/phosphatase family metal-dependent hydrolase
MAIATLLMVYLSVYVRPDYFWPLAFLGLAYPVILIANALLVVYWMLARRWYFLISLIVILVGWNHLKSFISYGSSSPPENPSISVLSYNVQVMGLYNYGPGWTLNFDDRNRIFRFLQEKDFDVICFQEFVHDNTGAFKTLDTLPQIIRAKHHHTGFTMSSKKINYFGLAIFSSYPIINRGNIEFDTNMGNNCIFADLKVADDTIRIYNVHFESIGLSREDFGMVENIAEGVSNGEKLRSGSIRILRRIKSAFEYRARQVELVADHIRNSPYPVILAGDFNDTPASWTYHYLTRELNDAFHKGRGTGQTYIGKVPGLRIDYILSSGHFVTSQFITGNQKYSDHYPIWSTLQLKNHTNYK